MKKKDIDLTQHKRHMVREAVYAITVPEPVEGKVERDFDPYHAGWAVGAFRRATDRHAAKTDKLLMRIEAKAKEARSRYKKLRVQYRQHQLLLIGLRRETDKEFRDRIWNETKWARAKTKRKQRAQEDQVREFASMYPERFKLIARTIFEED